MDFFIIIYSNRHIQINAQHTGKHKYKMFDHGDPLETPTDIVIII